MSIAFSRSMRSLEADRFRRPIGGLLLAAALLGAWFGWFFRSRVAVYEVTDTARLEVSQAAHPVEAPMAGRLVATRLIIGQEVRAGDLLVELDSDAQRLELEEARTRLATLTPQLNALRDEISAEERALSEDQQAALVALDEARARHREADALARLAKEEAVRSTRLHAAGILAEVDLLRAQMEAQRRQAASDTLELAANRLTLDQRTRESERKVRLERLKHETTQIQGQMATAAATIGRLQYEIERRRIRAPIAGRLGEVATLRIGAFVREGDKLGVVLPPGKLRVVADFLPPAALGRIRSGQPARLRLYGFPWTQYGSISATVESVAGEIRNDRVRVELVAHSYPASPIPFQHGLPGTVEVEVDRVSPATLVLRTAGKLLSVSKKTFVPDSRHLEEP